MMAPRKTANIVTNDGNSHRFSFSLSMALECRSTAVDIRVAVSPLDSGVRDILLFFSCSGRESIWSRVSISCLSTWKFLWWLRLHTRETLSFSWLWNRTGTQAPGRSGIVPWSGDSSSGNFSTGKRRCFVSWNWKFYFSSPWRKNTKSHRSRWS